MRSGLVPIVFFYLIVLSIVGFLGIFSLGLIYGIKFFIINHKLARYLKKTSVQTWEYLAFDWANGGNGKAPPKELRRRRKVWLNSPETDDEELSNMKAVYSKIQNKCFKILLYQLILLILCFIIFIIAIILCK